MIQILATIFGRGLGGVLSLISTIRNIPFLWKLITNWKLIEELLKKAWGIIESAHKSGGLPTAEQTRDLVQIARIIFEKDLIDLPELDEHLLAIELRELEHNLTVAIEKAREMKGLPQ